jgi:hypothetical protein
MERAGHVTGAIERDGDMPASGAIARTARVLGRHRVGRSWPGARGRAEGAHHEQRRRQQHHRTDESPHQRYSSEK